MGTPIALNYSTVLDVLKVYKIDDEELVDCFEKIVYLSQLDIAKINEKTNNS